MQVAVVSDLVPAFSDRRSHIWPRLRGMTGYEPSGLDGQPIEQIQQPRGAGGGAKLAAGQTPSAPRAPRHPQADRIKVGRDAEGDARLIHHRILRSLLRAIAPCLLAESLTGMF